jgi:hypothetical protein
MKSGLAMLALSVPMAVHAVNKCQGTDGKVVYSDLPCSMVVQMAPAPTPVAKVQPVVAPATATGAAARPASAQKTAPVATPAPSRLPADLNKLPPSGAGLASVRVVDFGRSIDTRLATVVTLLDSMALDGRNCEDALKADARKVAPCVPFATVMQPGREWSQALTEVNMLLQEPGLFERRRAEFTKASALIETISGHSKFIENRLSTTR